MGSQERTVLSMALVANVVRRGVPGDVIETGVYQGGSTIAMLHVLGLLQSPKAVYACDAFKGLPESVEQDSTGCKHALTGVPAQGCQRGAAGAWASARSVFDKNIQDYQHRINMSTHVRVLEGWFSDTLPRLRDANGGRQHTLCFLRLDGDVYSSTKVALEILYPMLSPGGVVYMDDYGSYAGCAQAVDDFMSSLDVRPELHEIWQWASRPETGSGNRVFEAIWWTKPMDAER
jgi:predicted O-methyltransferase YrrM